MKLIIPGGSGRVGTLTARNFHQDGHEVIVLSRNPVPAPWKVLPWDARSLGDWASEFERADVIINMAGRSVNCRYGDNNRREIIDSRVLSTQLVGEAIAAASHPPRIWLQASTATIYTHRFDAPNDEFTGILGGSEPEAPDTWRFSIEVAKAWESTLDKAITPHTRKLKLRSAMTMTADTGGVFDVLLGLVRHGFGGHSGNGRQFVSWVHGDDFVRALYFIIDHENLSGPVNISAPEPLPNHDFMRALREAWGIGWGLPATELMVEIGTLFLRTESELILKSRRVTPGILLQQGFQFKFPSWPEAARDLCTQWRENHSTISKRS